MKIAITSVGTEMDSQVDPRFGRAAYFAIVDTETMAFEAVENANVAAAGGAGISSAKVVIDAGAEAVLTGNCGPKAFRVLAEAGIKVYVGITGTAREAVEAFIKGELTEATGANVEGHW